MSGEFMFAGEKYKIAAAWGFRGLSKRNAMHPSAHAARRDGMKFVGHLSVVPFRACTPAPSKLSRFLPLRSRPRSFHPTVSIHAAPRRRARFISTNISFDPSEGSSPGLSSRRPRQQQEIRLISPEHFADGFLPPSCSITSQPLQIGSLVEGTSCCLQDEYRKPKQTADSLLARTHAQRGFASR